MISESLRQRIKYYRKLGNGNYYPAIYGFLSRVVLELRHKDKCFGKLVDDLYFYDEDSCLKAKSEFKRLRDEQLLRAGKDEKSGRKKKKGTLWR